MKRIVLGILSLIIIMVLVACNNNNCFLQVKIPHFCKTFSPGTGGEFFI